MCRLNFQVAVVRVRGRRPLSSASYCAATAESWWFGSQVGRAETTLAVRDLHSTEGHEQENVGAGHYETLTPWRIRRFFPSPAWGISQHCWLHQMCKGDRFDHQWNGKPLTELFHINVHIWKDNLLLLTAASSLCLSGRMPEWNERGLWNSMNSKGQWK